MLASLRPSSSLLRRRLLSSNTTTTTTRKRRKVPRGVAPAWTTDDRIDPRIRSVFGRLRPQPDPPAATTRAEALQQAAHPRMQRGLAAFTNALDDEMGPFAGGRALAPSAGLAQSTHAFTSAPDGNRVKVSLIRPAVAADESSFDAAAAADAPLPAADAPFSAVAAGSARSMRPMPSPDTVVYLHGGGMAMYSPFLANFQTFGRLIASHGVAVALVDFRNSVHPSTGGSGSRGANVEEMEGEEGEEEVGDLGEDSRGRRASSTSSAKGALGSASTVGAYPAGLNDCVSAVRWVASNREALGLGERIIVAGESGGGNLSIATALRLLQLDREGECECECEGEGEGEGGGKGEGAGERDDGDACNGGIGIGGGDSRGSEDTNEGEGEGKASNTHRLLDGVYAMAPFIGGVYPNPLYPSTTEHAGIVLSTEALATYAAAYGDKINDDPLAWPSQCSVGDLHGMPPIVVSVNEFDPLRDEGIAFSRLCKDAGVDARCITVPGTVHAVDSFFPAICPELTTDNARNIANLCKGGGKL